MSFRARFLGAVVLVALASLGATIIILPGILRQHRYGQLESDLSHRTALVRRLLAPGIAPPLRTDRLRRETMLAAATAGARVTVVASNGVVLADSEGNPRLMENHADRPEIRRALSMRPGESVRYSRTLHEDRMYLALPLTRNDRVIGAIRLSVPVRAIEADVWQVTITLLSLLIFIGGAALLLNLRILDGLLQPISRMCESARQIERGDLRHRVRVEATGEVDELARSFNNMAASLENRIGRLREAELTIRAAFAHMADGVVVLDRTNRIVLMNRVAEEVFGWTAERARGRGLLEITLHPELDALIQETTRSGERSSAEIDLRRPQPRILRVFATSVVEERSPFGMVLVFHDLTEIRRLENARRDFVTNASHELKTPLASIGAMIEAARSSGAGDPETTGRYLETVAAEIRRMGALVDDLLNLSRLDAGRWRLEREILQLGALLRAVIERFRPAIEKKSLRLETEIDRDVPVDADPDALILIASNVLDNAIKYTPDGGSVRVSCEKTEDGASFTVADSGIGIAPRDHARIFERFYRVDSVRSRKTGGTGLGLSIARHLTELHGGAIEVESEPESGSRFTVRLPVVEEMGVVTEEIDVPAEEIERIALEKRVDRRQR